MKFNYNTLDQRKKIVIVEDNESIRHGYHLIINSNPMYNVVNTYDTCEKAIRNLKKDSPEIILMDLQLPGMSGIAGIAEIKKRNPQIKIVVITVFEESSKVFEALCAGAIGYITKSADHNEILDAIHEVLNEGAPMSAKIANMVVRSFQRNYNTPLSKRETQVLELLSRGATYQAISDDLHVSIETVKSHIKHIYSKLHVNNKTDALKTAKRDNLI